MTSLPHRPLASKRGFPYRVLTWGETAGWRRYCCAEHKEGTEDYPTKIQQVPVQVGLWILYAYQRLALAMAVRILASPPQPRCERERARGVQNAAQQQYCKYNAQTLLLDAAGVALW